MEANGLLARRPVERLSALSATAQAAVPGVYAWAVTVAPSAWTTGASLLARIMALVAFLALAGGVLAERRWPARARVACVWTFVSACAVTWAAVPRGLSAFRVDAPRGLAGMLAWALFAFASSAPVGPWRSASVPKPSLGRRLDADATYLAIGTLLAASTQVMGWAIVAPERALLVRFIAIAAGLAIIGTSAQIALARRGAGTNPPTGRLRRAAPALVLLGLLALSGLLIRFLD